MAFQIAWFPVLIIAAIVIEAIVYFMTKSWFKMAYALEIILALGVFLLSLMITDSVLMVSIDLLALGLLINGIISLFIKIK